MLFQDADHFVDSGDVLRRRRLEPAHTLILAARIPRSPEAGWFFKVAGKPFSYLVESDFFITGQET